MLVHGRRTRKSAWQLDQTTLSLSGSLCLLSLHERLFFFFLPFFPSSLSTSIYCCSYSCPAITSQPTPLISLPSFVLSRPSSRPNSIISSSISCPMALLSVFIHFKWGLHKCKILLFGNCFAPPSVPVFVLCFAWCPVALGKGCVPGWIPGCVVLISVEWPLHHYWGWLFCLGNFTTMPLATLTPVTWSLSP